MNIVDLIKNNLSGSVLGQLGSLIGASPEQTKAAADASVPVILAGMGKAASSKDGAERLSEILAKLDPSMVDNMGGMFTGDNAGKVEEQGGGMLDKTLGGGVLGSLGDILGKFSGLGGGIIKKLLTYLLPLILGTIAKQLGGKTSAQGLTQFFSEQKSNINSAMPAGLSLGSIPGLGDVGASVEKAADTLKSGASQLTWVLPIMLLALGIVLWFYFKPDEPTKMPPNPEIAKAINQSITGSLEGDIKGFFDSATKTFTDIKDAASAEAALPTLKDLDSKVAGFKKGYSMVPEAGKGAIKALLTDGISKLKTLVDKLLAMPGVGEKLKPVVEPLMAKLSAITG